MVNTFEFYDIDKLPDGRVLAIAKTWQSLMNLVNDLTNDLNSIGYDGSVIIDDTLSKGLSDRFYEIPFHHGAFDFNKFEILHDACLEVYQNEWLRKHKDILETSVLSLYEQKTILNTSHV